MVINPVSFLNIKLWAKSSNRKREQVNWISSSNVERMCEVHQVVSSNLTLSTVIVAQLAERRFVAPEVVGSIPIDYTNIGTQWRDWPAPTR